MAWRQLIARSVRRRERVDLRDELITVAELAIGIAGFSAVVVALSPHGKLHERDLQRFGGLMVLAASAVALAFVPSLLHASGLSGPALWRSASGIMVVVWVAGMLPYSLLMRRLRRSPSSAAVPSALSVAALVVPAITNLALQAANASGIIWAPGAVAYFVGLLVWLWTSGVLFVAIVVNRPDA